MIHHEIINGLSRTKNIFWELLSNQTKEDYTWRPAKEKWCLLEIACHLFDEEREDFRTRMKQVLTSPDEPFPPLDPVAWVLERKYMQQDFALVLHNFLSERDKSVEWLLSLTNPAWKNAYQHPKFGPLSAEMFLANWLAHDYLHIRQITALKFNLLKHRSGENLKYAGDW